MNKFSDLLAINDLLDLKITLGVVGSPLARVGVNGRDYWHGQLYESWSSNITLPLRDPICIEIELRDKQYSQTQETALIIQELTIDSLEIVPGWTHLASYHNDHNETGPTTYLGFNGVWSLSISVPFYQWRHRILNLGWLLDPEVI